ASASAKAGADAATAAKPGVDDASAKGGSDKPAEAGASSGKPGAGRAAGATGKGGADAAAASAGKPSADDSERTAVFRAPKVDSASGGAKPSDESADSERTAVFRAVKPEAKAPDKPVASRPVPPKAVGGERASTFVPLRKDEDERPAAKPTAAQPATAEPTAKPAAPAPAKPAAPASAPAPAPVPERTERTTQQPLPPKPPLDLLADLTNNPPPPPSPLRTFIRRFKIYAPLVVLLAVILAVVQLVRPLPEPKLTMTAKSSYTFDGGNPVLPWPKEGQGYMAAAGLGTVGSFGDQKSVAIGSVAKTMTAYVILKDHPLKKGEKGPMIDVDKTAVDDGAKSSEGESTVGTLKAGDKISEYDALAAIMIPSANNVARLLARWDSGGDQDAFVKKMNDAARELGMANTTYTDPSGLDATTVSTAEDQVKLGLKVVEMPELVAITRLPEWTDPYGKKWRNYNTLIPGNGALGIKTGSTTKAGGNLLFAAEKKVGKTNQLIVGAVLGQYGVPILDTAIAASKQVMLATQKMLVNAPVVKKGDVVGYVDDGLGGHTPVIATADVEAVGWPSLTVDIKLADGDAKLPQTAKAGTEIGMLTVGEGASQVKVPVALQSDLVAPGIGSKLTRIG
ncbi:D-alanyl-D-alanine carboxypeptidase family protein, partial [Streptomyces sp. NPDC056387]|uniref:D-alanyl-D-alanine carboxypeptidase family protein n=1 Tax=Streptomyces sp. NPDC056387 TaxID=3345803 RepID=UPI0035E04CFF